MPSSLNSSLENWGCIWEGDRTVLLAWWLVWRDPTSAIVGIQNLIAWGSEDLLMVTEVTWGNYQGNYDGWFLDGIRFPSPKSISNLVAFLDKTPYTI